MLCRIGKHGKRDNQIFPPILSIFFSLNFATELAGLRFSLAGLKVPARARQSGYCSEFISLCKISLLVYECHKQKRYFPALVTCFEKNFAGLRP